MKAWSTALAVAGAALLLLVPAARSDPAGVIWSSPTPNDQARFSVSPGKQVRVSMTASSEEPGGIVHISSVSTLPVGVQFNSSDGVAAHASFTWRPEEPGDYQVQFTATLVGTTTTAPTLTYVIHVKGTAVKYPHAYTLTNTKIAHWSPVLRKAVVRAQPKASAKAVATLGTRTTDSDTQNLVLILSGLDVDKHTTWYRVRLPILPNNSTGWMRATDLGDRKSTRLNSSTRP